MHKVRKVTDSGLVPLEPDAKVWALNKQSTKVGCTMASLLQNSDLKKIRKPPGLSGMILNQILYDYTVEVTNRFRGLDLVECLKNYGWRFMMLYRRQ